jgi:hypothetical protein
MSGLCAAHRFALTTVTHGFQAHSSFERTVPSSNNWGTSKFLVGHPVIQFLLNRNRNPCLTSGHGFAGRPRFPGNLGTSISIFRSACGAPGANKSQLRGAVHHVPASAPKAVDIALTRGSLIRRTHAHVVLLSGNARYEHGTLDSTV